MRWIFRIVFALMRGGFAFIWLAVAGWLLLVTPNAEERQSLGSAFQDTEQGREQVVTMRLARLVLAVAPNTAIAVMTRLAPTEISAAQLRTALEVVAQGPGTAERLAVAPVTTMDPEVGYALNAPPRVRRVGRAKFMRPPE